MPRKKRNFKNNSYYHLFNRGNNRYKVFKQSSDKKVFLNMLYTLEKHYEIKIVAHCIMSNHFHLIVWLGDRPQDLSFFMHSFMTRFCMYINRKYNRVGHVFQGRYNAKCVKTDKGLIRLQRYLKENPVKEGLVRDSADYKWLRV